MERTANYQPRANRNSKDSVFCDLFSRGEYLLRLYRDLHPEDEGIAEADLEVVTLGRVLTRGQYNDLGFVARGRMVVLVEAQSTWTPNVALRMLFYLADTYRRMLAKSSGSAYSTAKLGLPVPELYVVYTGGRGDVPAEISLARDVLGDRSSAAELRVGVVSRPAGGILGEYVDYARTFDESVAAHGRTLEAARAAIDSCIERGVLREYLAERRQEVIDMMLELMDQEEAMRAYRAEISAEARAEGRAEGIAAGHAQGRAEAVRALEASSGMSRAEALSVLGLEGEERAAVEALLG